DEGFTKLLFDESNHRVLGGGIVGTHAGDLIGEVCLAVEMGCDPVDIGKTIYPHPTLGESIGMAAEVFEGVCTDLPPTRKKSGLPSPKQAAPCGLFCYGVVTVECASAFYARGGFVKKSIWLGGV